MFLDFWHVITKHINAIIYQHVNRRANSVSLIIVVRRQKETLISHHDLKGRDPYLSHVFSRVCYGFSTGFHALGETGV